MYAADKEPQWVLEAGVRGEGAEIGTCLLQTSCGHGWPLSV